MDWRSKFGIQPVHQSPVQPGFKCGMLTVIEKSHVGYNYAKYWRCLCMCGNTVVLSQSSLFRGAVASCGCTKKKPAKQEDAEEATKRTWMRMTSGADADEVIASWEDFENFCKVMGLKSGHKILRRHDAERGYVRGNCYWGRKPEIVGEYNGPCNCGRAVRRKQTVPGSKNRPYINVPCDEGRPRSKNR